MSASRDRTQEFDSVVRLMRGRAGEPQAGGSRQQQLHRQRSQFALAARQVGADLGRTCAKVEKLALLAKRQSLFDDRVPEIQELTYIVRQDLNGLNQAIAGLQKVARNGSVPGGQQAKTHSNTVVLALQTKLATMSNRFRDVLEARTEVLKRDRQRREQFASPAARSSADLLAKPSVLVQDEQMTRASSEARIDMTAAEGAWKQQQQQQQLLLDQSEDYLASRADTMRTIEQTMVDLGGIFQQLAAIVKEQDEIVHRIDAGVEETTMNVESAHAELLKFFKSVSSNRWLMIKVFGVLVVFFVIFVVFLS